MTVHLPLEQMLASPYRSADRLAASLRPCSGPAVDCVYMLMFPGWEHELRSNRWHYATRWARRLPVVLVQPTQLAGEARSMADARIPNCRILQVAAASYAPDYFADSVRQTAQILGDMRAHGYSRPLLWLYNPQLAASYAGLPAVCRLFHATENYFQFAGSTEFFLAQTRAALRVSDLVVTVSDGVAASIAPEVPSIPLHTVTNGCDYRFYSSGMSDAAFSAERSTFERIAIYAGNINWRLEFDLIARCASALPRTLFAFYGPVIGLTGRNRRGWTRLRKLPNVRHYPPVEADALPGLYASADLGIVPYKDDPWIVDNGFPLKVLEMCAAGLPVITTLMKPIRNLGSAVSVCSDGTAFVHAAAQRSRASLSAEEREEMRSVCLRNDYDRKFEQIASLVAAAANVNHAASVRGDQVGALLPVVKGPRARLHAWLRNVAKVIPTDLRRRIPPSARRVLCNWLER